MPQGPYLPEGFRLHTPENRWVNTPAAMDQAAEEEQILEGIVTRCDCAHNLVVDCNGITGYTAQKLLGDVPARRHWASAVAAPGRSPFCPGWENRFVFRLSVKGTANTCFPGPGYSKRP